MRIRFGDAVRAHLMSSSIPAVPRPKLGRLASALVAQHFGRGAFPGFGKLGSAGKGMSQKALQRLSVTRIPNLKSAGITPSARTLEDFPGRTNPLPFGGPLGGPMLTRKGKGRVSLA